MSNVSKNAIRLKKRARDESREFAADLKDLASEAKDALTSAAQTVTAKVGASRKKLKNAAANLGH